MIETFLGIVVLSIFVEAIITYFLPRTSELPGDPGTAAPRWWIKYVSASLGIAVCVAYKADLPAALGLMTGVPFVGSVLTGVVVGRGSNFVNDFISRIKNPAPTVLVESGTTNLG